MLLPETVSFYLKNDAGNSTELRVDYNSDLSRLYITFDQHTLDETKNRLIRSLCLHILKAFNAELPNLPEYVESCNLLEHKILIERPENKKNRKSRATPWNISIYNPLRVGPALISFLNCPLFVNPDNNQAKEKIKNDCLTGINGLLIAPFEKSHEYVSKLQVMLLSLDKYKIPTLSPSIPTHSYRKFRLFRHSSPANLSNGNNAFGPWLKGRETYNELTGDALKAQILQNVIEYIYQERDRGVTREQIVDAIIISPEFKILRTSQGRISRALGRETSSVNELENILNQAGLPGISSAYKRTL